MPRIVYENEATVAEENSELSLLEISLKHGIPHMHACGGNGRCSTCRIIVTEGIENCTPRTETEETLALSRDLPENIRLACQTRVTGPVTLRRLVLDNRDYEAVRTRSESSSGREDNLAILFSDIRNFTSFSERNLPYDIIHILNRYFEEMGRVILANGGMLDKYIGDGLMANFGLKQNDPESICVRAVNAGLEMLEALKGVNAYAKTHLNHEFQIGIGIHYGNVIVGELGHHSNAAFTLIGDAVNTASRLESMTKKAKAALLISEDVYQYVKQHVRRGRVFQAPLKGKSGRFLMYEILGIDTGAVETHLESGARVAFRELREVARETFALVFDRPPAYNFIPGQFADLSFLEDRKGQGEAETRSFSISSAPGETELRIVTRNTGSDFKKRLLALRPGEQMHLSEATGQLIKRQEPRRRHVFIAGGIGVTPFYSIIRHEFDADFGSDLVLIHSNRDRDSILYFEEFQKMDAEFTGFHYAPTLTKSIPGDWPARFERGYVTAEMIERHAQSLEDCIFYLAGAPAFVSALQDMLADAGVAPTRILREDFYGY